MKRSYFLFCFLILSTVLVAQTPFTYSDALEVQSFGQTSLSPDGKYLAGTQSSGYRSRFLTDHSRFREPGYIASQSEELLIYDLDAGTSKSPFGKAQHIQSMAWSPDSKRIALLKVENGKPGLHILDVENSTSRQIRLNTALTLVSNSYLAWVPNEDAVLVEMRASDWLDRAKKHYEEANNGPITVYNSEEPFLKWDALGNLSNETTITKVSINNGQISEVLPAGNYGSYQIAKDGSFLVYRKDKGLKTSYNRRDGAEYTWIKQSLSNPADTMVVQAPSKKRTTYRFSPDKNWMAWADEGHIMIKSMGDTAAINLTEGKNILVEEDSAELKFSPEVWNELGTQLVARTKYGLYRIDREKETLERFMEFDPDEEDAPRYGIADWHPNGRYLYLSYNASDRWERGLVRYNFQNNALESLIKSENLFRNWRFSEDGSRIVYELSDGNRPGDYYTNNPDLTKQSTITNLNPWIKDKKFTKTELVSYLDSDGKELYGILYYPVDYEEGKKYPLVCEIYERFFDNGYRASMNIIANEGYFGFRPSVNLEEGRPGVAWIKGVTAGINKLIEMGLVDEDKIGVHGTSYGGYAASLLIAQTNRFAAAINISGKTNMISFLGDSPKIGTRNYAAAEVGQDRVGESLWEAPMKYIEHSAIMYADKMNTPHLLLTGAEDWNVPAANTRELYYALRRLGKKVVWVDYKHAGHGAGWAGDEETYNDQWKRILDWYTAHFEDKKE
ncbi:MAG: prolyl oligopeptidase family serine peptidase [Bacteroidota bacterium]